MMGYSKESKSYRLFDPVKYQIIIRRNVISDEKYSGIKLLNSSSGLLHSDPFDIVPKPLLIVPLLGIFTTLSTSLPESLGSQSTPTEIVTSERNDSTLTPCVPRWTIKTLESAGSDVGDISSD